MVNTAKLIFAGICLVIFAVFFLKMKGKMKEKKKFAFPEKYLPFTLFMAALILTSFFVGNTAADMRGRLGSHCIFLRREAGSLRLQDNGVH